MRSLVLALLSACSFSPGPFGAGGGSADASIVDMATTNDIDATELDAAVVDPAGFVRRIDLVDAMISGTHTDFPLLVTLTENWLKSTTNGGDVARADGFDIYFSSDQAGASKLAFQLERLDTTGGNLVAWVKLPTLTATTVLYIHYGDPAITQNQAQPTQVWSNGYELVMHMNDSGDSTTKNVPMATGVGVGLGIASSGSFDGLTSTIDAGNGSAVNNIFTAGGTVEAWFFADTFGEGSRGRIFHKGDYSGWSLFVVNDSFRMNSIAFAHGNSGFWYGPANSVTTGVWHHLAVTYDKTLTTNTPVAILDGVGITMSLDDTPTAPQDDSAQILYVGNSSGNSRTFDGNLDEVRLSSSPRADSWISTQYRNQANPAAFYSVSAPL